jgi:hypothetical protein
MKKFILALTLTLVSGIYASAQSNDDYKKAEFFVGYSYGQADAHFNSNNPNIYRDRTPLHGFNASAVYNLSRYFGIKGDVSGASAKANVNFLAVPVSGTSTSTILISSKNSLYNVLGGVQIKDNASTKRLKPFAHALVGAAFRKNTITPGIVCVATIICPSSTSETGLAMAFGGGLDIRLNRRVDIRAFQIDYNPVKTGGTMDDNLRFSIGVVFR